MEPIIRLTKENIQAVVDQSATRLVMLTFWAQQQAESVQMLNTLEQIANSQQGRFILASVDCETEMEIANYFQIQALPTTMLLENGRPLDGFSGVQDAEQVMAMLDKHLPPQWKDDVDEVKTLLAQGELTDADLTAILKRLKQAYEDSGKQAEIALLMADVQLQLGELTEAKVSLDVIGLADQDSYYHSLMAKLALALDATDTPEIRQLQETVAAAPDDLQAVLALAKALHKTKRDEEALDALFVILQKDLTALDGQVKQVFMEMLTAIGQGNAIANQYRRKLYTLLY
ncbi:thioredoxin-related [Shewanella denitrificans OS217]|jgi:putative thioredoxin|uniref:Thioredoxin-related n=1 Tax=Shewanella denitrificans (strain OS217 / ATCC BAA-1090 / DSM 15013) TaxID=318161 RepID=Q12PB1_SHEDO|nr:tetratricopeptide repeat protein [Shewanella denitrificans]ABE54715.1 thioredoxin-related [Shewanella denitrificans OS217]